MKKNMIMLTLLGVTLSAVASNAPQEGPVMMTTVGSLAPEVQWSAIPVSNDVKEQFDSYVKNIKASASQASDLNLDFGDVSIALINDFIDSGFVEANDPDRVVPMVEAFCGMAGIEANNAVTNGSDPKALQGLKDLYLEGTLGAFTGKMYDRLKSNTEGTNANALLKLNVRTRIALRNDGYHKEYFQGEQADNEKSDGRKYYFYSEYPVNRPSGLLAMLGFGYTDKRSWGKYLMRKGFGVAALGAAGAGAYYGYKQYAGRQPEPEPVEIVQPVKWDTEWKRQARETVEGLKRLPGRVVRSVYGTQSWDDGSGYRSGDMGTVENLKTVPGRVKGHLAAQQQAWQQGDGYMTGEMGGVEGLKAAGRKVKHVAQNHPNAVAERNVHEANKEIAQLKKQRNQALNEAKHYVKPVEVQQPSFLRRMFGAKAQSQPQPTYGMNIEGSAFDIEGGLPLGTTYERMQVEQQMKKDPELRKQIMQDRAELKKNINEGFKMEEQNIRQKWGAK